MITLTARAIAACKRLLLADGKAGQAIRFHLRPGGCAGTKYGIEFTSDQGENDHVFVQGGLRIICGPEALASLDGLRVDYVDALVGGGFQYENPNATTTCSCGQSFDTLQVRGG